MTPKIITRAEREARWKGLGDVVASLTKAVGIKPCGGCRERQAKLNQAIPFGSRQENTKYSQNL